MKYFIYLAMLLLVFNGCAHVRPVHQRMEFPESEYQQLSTSGTAIVKGQAFLTTRGGDVKTAAGRPVNLTPATSYSIEWFEKTKQGMLVGPPDPKHSDYIRTTNADGDGRFTFNNVPPGRYFVITVVTWDVPTRYSSNTQGGIVYHILKIEDGEEHDIIVNRLLR